MTALVRLIIYVWERTQAAIRIQFTRYEASNDTNVRTMQQERTHGHDRCVVDLSDESMISRWVSVSGWQRKGHVPLSARLRGDIPA